MLSKMFETVHKIWIFKSWYLPFRITHHTITFRMITMGLYAMIAVISHCWKHFLRFSTCCSSTWILFTGVKTLSFQSDIDDYTITRGLVKWAESVEESINVDGISQQLKHVQVHCQVSRLVLGLSLDTYDHCHVSDIQDDVMSVMSMNMNL